MGVSHLGTGLAPSHDDRARILAELELIAARQHGTSHAFLAQLHRLRSDAQSALRERPGRRLRRSARPRR